MPGWEDIKKRTEERAIESSETQVLETNYYRVEGLRNSISKLEFRLKSGATFAIDYSLMPVLFSPSNDKIIIPTMLNLKITISGNNLGNLKMYLTDSRVKWAKEHSGTKPPIKDDDLFIESIKIEPAAFEEAIEKLID